ncbi:hypothetical protein OH76DRAFT_1201869 [Lentinus brumalis]|uniref:Uncharacterized protein n=1 Tax=Lentinus brumalis TaxID=2498619 RepID=A0A371CTA1_9APHY|nr:hypothetical protein OH76DRAFT_1201869 [Polyporus brumalis]
MHLDRSTARRPPSPCRSYPSSARSPPLCARVRTPTRLCISTSVDASKLMYMHHHGTHLDVHDPHEADSGPQDEHGKGRATRRVGGCSGEGSGKKSASPAARFLTSPIIDSSLTVTSLGPCWDGTPASATRRPRRKWHARGGGLRCTSYVGCGHGG